MEIIKNFDSLQAFSRYLDSNKVTKVFEGRDASINCKPADAGTNSYEEAQNLLVRGDRANYENVQKVVGYVNPNCLPSGAPGFHRAKKVCGGAVNVGAVLAGSYNCFVGRKRSQEAAKFVTINYCIGDNYSVGADYKTKAGARLMGAVRVLEANKIRCAINIIALTSEYVYPANCKKGTTNYVGAVINVKSAATPLNEIALSYPVINPSMLRRHFFRFEEVTEGIGEEFRSGYGCAVDIQETQKVIKVPGVYLNCDKINGFLSVPELAKLIAAEAK